jgi:uncharacterized protein (TIGR02001 family)
MYCKSFAAALLALCAVLPEIAQAEVSFNLGATTDYRYRGISQTRLRPAVQGGVDYTQGGFYLGAWASTIKWIKDGGGDSDLEIDLYGGYKGALSKDLSYDVGVLTYVYPSNKLKPITGANADTTELYGALTFGPATLKYSHAVTTLFATPNSKNSGYVDLSGSFDVSGFTVVPHLGYQRVAKNGDFSYTDYSLTVSKDFSGVLVSGALIGADLDIRGPNNKRLDKAGLVLSAKYTF